MSEAREPGLSPAALSTASVPVLIGTGLVLCLVAAVCTALWSHWSGNADLSHGLLMPVVFIYLIHEARCRGVARYSRPSTARNLAGLALGATTIVFGSGGILYASALGWGQALAAGFAGIALSALLLLAILSLSDRRIRLIPCNWQALCAALLWLLTIPLPPGAYTRLSGSLQQGISQAVLLSLNILGIPATRQGNIIELAHARVGVEEACSGVRSLIACIFAALLISALVLRSPWRRALLVVIAPILALLMNLARSLGLTLLANAGIDIGGTWHDATGFAILALTALLLFLLAQGLEEGTKHKTAKPKNKAQIPAMQGAAALASSQEAKRNTPSTEACSTNSLTKFKRPQARQLLVISGCMAFLVAGLSLLQVLPREAKNPEIPNLEEALPKAVDGWTQHASPELKRFQKVLRTEHLLERSYTNNVGKDRIQVTLYAAAWEPGTSTPAEISLHTPEVCWPGAGWTQIAATEAEFKAPAGAKALRFRSPSGEIHQVVYWLLYDGSPVAHLDPYSPPDLLRLALAYGHRAPAPQLFVRISGNRPHDELLQLAPVRQALHALGISDLSSSP